MLFARRGDLRACPSRASRLREALLCLSDYQYLFEAYLRYMVLQLYQAHGAMKLVIVEAPTEFENF